MNSARPIGSALTAKSAWRQRGYADADAGRPSNPPDDGELRAAYRSGYVARERTKWASDG